MTNPVEKKKEENDEKVLNLMTDLLKMDRSLNELLHRVVEWNIDSPSKHSHLIKFRFDKTDVHLFINTRCKEYDDLLFALINFSHFIYGETGLVNMKERFNGFTFKEIYARYDLFSDSLKERYCQFVTNDGVILSSTAPHVRLFLDMLGEYLRVINFSSEANFLIDDIRKDDTSIKLYQPDIEYSVKVEITTPDELYKKFKEFGEYIHKIKEDKKMGLWSLTMFNKEHLAEMILSNDWSLTQLVNKMTSVKTSEVNGEFLDIEFKVFNTTLRVSVKHYISLKTLSEILNDVKTLLFTDNNRNYCGTLEWLYRQSEAKFSFKSICLTYGTVEELPTFKIIEFHTWSNIKLINDFECLYTSTLVELFIRAVVSSKKAGRVHKFEYTPASVHFQLGDKPCCLPLGITVTEMMHRLMMFISSNGRCSEIGDVDGDYKIVTAFGKTYKITKEGEVWLRIEPK